ncbi:MAG: benzoyl-CoA-dihydrodiol lyase, partial [Gammaproteobacteria bacterium]|nr:benzoyl-CoA-dihydrodiol lyase [Gammaproteobacteria bacterium]
RALELAAPSDRPADAAGITLGPLQREVSAAGLRYRHVSVTIDRAGRTASFVIRAPGAAGPADITGIVAAGDDWWPLALGRELDDAILSMRTNEPDIGIWLLRTAGDPALVLAVDQVLEHHRTHWFVRETIGLLRRALARLDVSSRTLFALIEPGSCFAGTLLELALAGDRAYMLAQPDAPAAPTITLSSANFGWYPLPTGESRLERRFYREQPSLAAVRAHSGEPLDAALALRLGLVTSAPDEIDWADEVRIAIEERASLSPDALTGLEANLRFNGPETMTTRIFGRLSAWQNWIFNRPNATGDKGTLKTYGRGERPQLDTGRV